jgi:hypothetical protein
MGSFAEAKTSLEQTAAVIENKHRARGYIRLSEIFGALAERDLDPAGFESEFSEVQSLTSRSDSGINPSRVYEKLKRRLEKEYHLVTPGHYQAQWLALGLSVFGIPFGVIFATALDNFAFLGLGLPIGMAIGMSIGAGYDRKAKEEGRVLSVTPE